MFKGPDEERDEAVHGEAVPTDVSSLLVGHVRTCWAGLQQLFSYT